MEFDKKIIIFKNDRLGDLLHSVPAINNVIDQNPDKEIIIFLSKISKNFYFLFKKKKYKVKNIKLSFNSIRKNKNSNIFSKK